jgi:hypothetical protein
MLSAQLIAAYMQICTFVFPARHIAESSEVQWQVEFETNGQRQECLLYLSKRCKGDNLCLGKYLEHKGVPGDWTPPEKKKK